MCYRTISHKLRCDVRPLISNGHVSIVDGYAQPTSCGCAASANIKRWLRCEHHGCCRVATKIHLCADPDSCAGEVVFHSYTQAKFEVRDWTNNNVWPDAPWLARPVLDSQRLARSGQAPGTRLRYEAPLFRAALETLLKIGRTIAAVEYTVGRWISDRGRLLASLKEHSSVAPAMNPANRNLLSAVVLLDEALDRGMEEKHSLVDEFGLAQDELEKLERWGERPVTGLNHEQDWDIVSVPESESPYVGSAGNGMIWSPVSHTGPLA